MTIKELILKYISRRDDYENIVFVVLQGGTVRKGFTLDDTVSGKLDIDISIAYETRHDNVNHAPITKGNDNYAEMFRDIMIDYRPLFLDEIGNPHTWKERIRYIWTNETLFVCGNFERYKNIRSAAAMTADEQKELLLHYAIHIQTKGIWPDTSNDMPELSIDKTAERKDYWEKKGLLVYGIIMRMRALEPIEGMIFALNGLFLPSPKYREYLLERLEWQPKKTHDMLRALAYGDENSKELMTYIVSQCKDRAEMLGVDFSKCYKMTFKTDVYSIRTENKFF